MIRVSTPDVPDTERRFPRTLEQAFGSRARSALIAEPPEARQVAVPHKLLRELRALLAVFF